jgi:cytochrome c biogenesis protein CcdA
VFANLTADGKKLLLNTVAYAAGTGTPIPALQLSGTRVASKIRVTWTDSAAKLESASAVNGSYTTITNATSPYDQDISSAQQQFFRLKK